MSLRSAGLTPADIDIVFLTHLHSDHVRGIGRQVNSEQGLLFPNARFLVRGVEWRRFASPAESRVDIEDALRLLEPRIELIEKQELAKPATIGIGTHLANAVIGQVTLAQGKYHWHMHQ